MHDLAHQPDLAFGRFIHAGDHVEKRTFSRAIRTDQRMDFARLQVHRHGVVGHQPAKAFGHSAGLQQHLAGRWQRTAGQQLRASAAGDRVRPEESLREVRQRGPQALRKTLQHPQHQQAKHNDFKVAGGAQQTGQNILQFFLEQGDDRRAQHRTPEMSGAADHRHEQVFNADVEVERRRVHKPLQMRVKPARHGRQ